MQMHSKKGSVPATSYLSGKRENDAFKHALNRLQQLSRRGTCDSGFAHVYFLVL